MVVGKAELELARGAQAIEGEVQGRGCVRKKIIDSAPKYLPHPNSATNCLQRRPKAYLFRPPARTNQN